MKSFKIFLAESRNISPSRERMLDNMTAEGRMKIKYEDNHKLTDEQKDAGVKEVFGEYISRMPANQGIDKKIIRSKLPHHHAKLLDMAIGHFENGIDAMQVGIKYKDYGTYRKGRNQLAVAKRAVHNHLGRPYADMLANNDTRPILKGLAHG